MLAVHPKLTTLKLSGTQLPTASFIALADALTKYHTLEELDLSDNLKNSKDSSPSNHRLAITHLSKAILNNKSLKKIKLSQIGLSDEDILVDLGNAIAQNKQLQSVNLSKYHCFVL